jgi:hypothetical protein
VRDIHEKSASGVHPLTRSEHKNNSWVHINGPFLAVSCQELFSNHFEGLPELVGISPNPFGQVENELTFLPIQRDWVNPCLSKQALNGFSIFGLAFQVRNGCSKSRWSTRSNLQPVTLIREGLAPTSNERRAACATSGAGSNWENHQGPIKDFRCGAIPFLKQWSKWHPFKDEKRIANWINGITEIY